MKKLIIAIALFFISTTAESAITSSTAFLCQADGTYVGIVGNPEKAEFDRDHTLIFTLPCPPNSADPATNAVCITEAQANVIDVIETKYRKCIDTDANTFMDDIVEMSEAEKEAVDGAEQTVSTNATRSSAESVVDNFDRDGVILRAFMLVVMDEFNRIRADLDAFSKESAFITDVNRPARTVDQLKTSLKDKINSGDAD